VKHRVCRTAAGVAVSALVLAALASCRKESGEPAGAFAPVTAITTPSGVEMVLIPGGWFEMGSAQSGEIDESPHKVSVSSFYMDRCEVTQEEYERLMGKNPSHWKKPKNPVEQIRWPAAIQYCNARSREEGLQPAYDPKTGQCNFEADG